MSTERPLLPPDSARLSTSCPPVRPQYFASLTSAQDGVATNHSPNSTGGGPAPPGPSGGQLLALVTVCAMASWDEVRQIALALPETSERIAADGSLSWRVKDKLLSWERPLLRSDLTALGLAEQPEPVLAAWVPDLGAKNALVADGSGVYFTTPHFDGHPSVLVWLDRIDPAELRELLVEAWLARAPKRVVSSYLDTKN